MYRHAGLGDDGDLDAVVQANLEFTYRYYGRLTQLRCSAARAALFETVDPRGIERLTDALSGKRGVILTSAHVGDFDIVGSWLAQAMGVKVVVVTDAVAERTRQVLFDDVRRAGGLILRRRYDTRLADLERTFGRGESSSGCWIERRAGRR